MKKFIIILFLIAISTTASANTKELILKTCQDLIKKDTKIHPRLINIKKHGKYKYTFDVVFIQRGKEVDWLKGSFFDKNYSCEYYPEEDTIYKQFSDKQLADDKAKREVEAKKKAEEKAIRLAKEAQLETDRRAKVAAERIKKEKADKAQGKVNASLKTLRSSDRAIREKEEYRLAKKCYTKYTTGKADFLDAYGSERNGTYIYIYHYPKNSRVKKHCKVKELILDNE